ncbi:beta-1,6-N-acetylglucosaminyltransferase [Polynucleobacter sp. IMCC 30228]|uniref:beta-1,6-N-acetylglucosaminyltransferase n=1 Tax=Polynucleobacter sp. IMCC 30228 TaxID=2781011 RepID=UPI001F16A02E|nr:beta-1,6-N-acetylglucosaminyltransferase [Polynucleobacter sp. IMCC 30228]MCE7527887.1 hypothetical protein [Polynucleobacter sp. IMCC 30228]
MKHGFLITAYRDFDSLQGLIEQLLNLPDAHIFINIDGRSKTLISQTTNYLLGLNNPRVYLQTQVVRWGSYEHMDVFMQLAQLAFDKECDYFHTITGQCRIIKSLAQFEVFFEQNQRHSYIQYFGLPDENWNGLGEPRLDRVKYYQLHDILDARKWGIFFVGINTLFIQIQKWLGINRLQDRKYYGGIVYFSINKIAMEYLLSQWPKLEREFRFTFCCEETAPQTILLNSPEIIRNTLVNFDLRFILWTTQHGENPGLLDERNLEQIQAGDYLFARKFDSRYSKQLIKSINQSIEL